ncbi:hypothetical protein CONCODRAFT_170586 [Conidiobolus coronatus NRRL 28638]|uniref:Uncharacterized protein n=1 Tax=Conidiobolus coronatus (strain ATCC 28846 / CBS 209.66 / NRRL 28638) TaxID=796925 RepID=A0A137P6I2_CONC2|nr:hypothetical protein CONCODRAFT_170586 [Conidiobolus coronatus NRRL 28638]|eukprot:KXN70630.1 hypothetical protein CONCODRAFT_170586 [Conidiobolus coronatus NRRL 28638]
MKLLLRAQLLAMFFGLNAKAQNFNLDALFDQFKNIGSQQVGGSSSNGANVAQSTGISQQNSQSASLASGASNPVATPTQAASTDLLFILPIQSFVTDPQSSDSFVSGAISTTQPLTFETTISAFNPVSTSEPVSIPSSADPSAVLSSSLPVDTSNIASMPTPKSTLTQSSADTISSLQSASFVTTPTFSSVSTFESATATGSASSGLPIFSVSSVTTSVARPSSSPTKTTSSAQPSPTPENKNEVYLAAVSILNTLGSMVNSFNISQSIKDATNDIIKNLATIIANFFK